MSSSRLGPVETKVKGSTLGAGSSSVLVAFLVWTLERYGLLTEPNGALDPVVVAMIALVVSAAGAFLGGYVMPHMERQRPVVFEYPGQDDEEELPEAGSHRVQGD